MPSPVTTLKEQNPAYRPLLLAAFTFTGQSSPSLFVATIPLDGVSNPTFPGVGSIAPFNAANNYLGRVAAQDIDALQQRSRLGIDGISKFTIHLYDADSYIWSNFVINSSFTPIYGFRGATVNVALVMWQPGTSNFSSDAPFMFTGTCDMEVPQQGGTVLSIAANTSHNTQTILLPLVPIQNRCPWVFPSNGDQRASAVSDPTSPYYYCGYGPDQGGYGNVATTGGPANDGKSIVDSYGNQVTDASGYYIMCDYTRSTGYVDAQSHNLKGGCMARLGNSATTTVAPDGDLMHDTTGRHTGAFGGVEWSPDTYYAFRKNYVAGSNIPTFSFMNSAILGQYQNLLYGTQFVNAKIANIIEDGNATRCEAMITVGAIANANQVLGLFGPTLVIVNGIGLGQNGNGSVDPLLRWNYTGGPLPLGAGSRNGVATADAGYNKAGQYSAMGDPYGNIATIECVFYKDIFTGFGIPTVQVLTTGPLIWQFAPIGTAVGNGTSITVTLANNLPNNYIGGFNPFPVRIVGNSWSTANGVWNLATSGWVTGPPGTVTLASSAFTGSGTGGYIMYQAAGMGTSGSTSNDNSNPAWVLIDLLLKCNWNIDELDINSFYTASQFCDTFIPYVNNVGNSTTHARYICQFCLDGGQRKTAGEVIAGVLRSFNGYLARSNTTGQLQLYINQTLADSQPAAITGSNYNSAVISVKADGSNANGYVAYSFNETNIKRIESRDSILPDIKGEANTTVLTPNQITLSFQDMDNQYVVDSLTQIDSYAVTRAGGATQPGGSLIPETLNCIGVSNFDQAIRIANVYLAERQYGNPAGDPRGTYIFTIGTTVKCEHLRVGHLVFLSWSQFNINMQLFRVLRISAETNGESWTLTLQWHDDEWYEDIFGQAPVAFYSQTFKNRPNRPPLPWQPDDVALTGPASGPLWSPTEYNFGVAELDAPAGDGSMLVSIRVSGVLPYNQINTNVTPPLAPVQATASTSAGSIPAGSYFIVISTIDTNGNYSVGCGLITGTLASTGELVVNGLGWPTGATGYDVFVGTDHFNITHQQKVTGLGSMPSSITISSLPNTLTYAPPDLTADSIYLQAKYCIRPGIIATSIASVGTNEITLSPPPSGSLINNLTGYHVLLIGRPDLGGADLPYLDYKVVTNAASVLTLDRDPTAVLAAGDIVMVCAQANIASANTIGDSNALNVYNPSGFVSADSNLLVRIIAGKGRYQMRTISSVASGTTYTVSKNWDTIPDSTSIFIVEENSWRPNSETTQINNSSYSSTQVGIVSVDNVPQSSSGYAYVVQALVGDSADSLYSNGYRSPIRIIWTVGAQGTRTITANTMMINTDGTVLCDTSSIAQTGTTLNGNINNSVTTITLTSITGVVNGTIIQIGTEQMLVVNSTVTTVVRAYNGTTAASHSNLDAVIIPGSLIFDCLPSSQIPNQTLIVKKISSDINYVIVVAGSPDTFDSGSSSILLITNLDSQGMTQIKFPGN